MSAFIYVIVAAALMGTQPVTAIHSSYETEAECKAAKIDVESTIKTKLKDEVVAFGLECIRVELLPGKKL